MSALGRLLALITIAFSPVVSPTPQLQPTVHDGLSAATMRLLSRNSTAFTTEPVPDGLPVSRSDAVRAVRPGGGFDKHAPAEIAYGKLTVKHYGRETATDPSKPSRIDPFIADRPVWLIVSRGGGGFVSGPHVSAAYDARRALTTYKWTGWVAVDAQSGEVLGGESDFYSPTSRDASTLRGPR